MDTKILRSATISSIVLLIIGLFIGTFGGLTPLLELPNNILGAAIIAIALSVPLILIYSLWFANFLPGSTLVKGILFGALVWIVFLILGGLFSFFKDSVYTVLNPGINLFLSLVLFTVWGGVATLSLESKN